LVDVDETETDEIKWVANSFSFCAVNVAKVSKSSGASNADQNGEYNERLCDDDDDDVDDGSVVEVENEVDDDAVVGEMVDDSSW
jgi:hypothetical protein